MRRWIFPIILGFYAAGGAANSSTDPIREDMEAGRISRTDAVYYEALRTFSSQDLPDRYVLSDLPTVKCGTGSAFQIRQTWPLFSAKQQAKLTPYAFRPQLSFSHVSPSGLFRVHYDTSGSDGVSPEDLDGSDVPDYVERTAEYLDHAYDVQVNQMGFRVPPTDAKDGPEWDAYVENLANTYGWTTPDDQVGVSPDRYTSFIRLDNDYTHTYSKGLNGLRVTSAHEFFHVVQFGYIARDDDDNGSLDDQFLMEASATWMEDEMYDSINDYVNYLAEFFKRTNVSFDRQDGWHEYGLSIWFHFLDKRYQGMNITRRVWDTLVELPGIQACDDVLQNLGSTFGKQLALFYGWNYMTGSRADTIRFYPEGNLYPEMKMDGAFTFTQDTMLTETVRPAAARYYSFLDTDGAPFALVPVNTGSPSMLSGECNIPLLLRDTEHSAYTEIKPGLYTGLLSEDDVAWEFTAVVGDVIGFYRMIPVSTNGDDRLGSISGIVWDDADRDRVRNEDEESGIPDVRLSLFEAGEDGILGSEDDVSSPASISNTGGGFRFPALEAGYYRVEVNAATLPDGYVSTMGDPVRTILLSENTDVTSINFGFALLDWLPPAFPQPFNPALHEELKIPFTLPESGAVRLALYTPSGYQVLNRTEYFNSGRHFFRWKGLDAQDWPVPGGIYLYILEAEGQVLRREKIAVVR